MLKSQDEKMRETAHHSGANQQSKSKARKLFIAETEICPNKA